MHLLLKRTSSCVIIAAALSQLSACSSLSAATEFLNIGSTDVDANNETVFEVSRQLKEAQSTEQTRVSEPTPEITLQIEKYELEQQQKELLTLKDEWESIRPSLSKVIAMSDDLAYVLEVLESKSVQDSIGLPEFTATISPTEVQQFGAARTLSIGQETAPPEFETSDLSFIQVNDQPENPIIPSTQDISAIDDKFQSVNSNNGANNAELLTSRNDIDNAPASNNIKPVALAYPQSPIQSEMSRETRQTQRPVTALASAGVDDSKFSSSNSSALAFTKTNPSKIVGDTNNSRMSATRSAYNCDIRPSSVKADGQQFAIHLASYSKEESLKDGLESIHKKFKESLCGLSAVYMPVQVKGTDYYSLRIGPFASESDAKSTCNNLSNENQYCGVTRFEGSYL